ncbi:MAG TPA: hypothetical protein VJO99_19815 [Burkholderiaceae bacterium]|nr:hypothetical protein [Burkholderiaceae bacterium]
MDKQGHDQHPPPARRWAERRCGDDRRKVDKGPPGKHERRRGVESRKPEVTELEMSDSEWTRLSQDPLTPGV